MMDQAILTLQNVSKFYTSPANVVMGLNSINLTFHRGEFVAITGESGSGKSTLSNVISGILPYESGELYFGGKPTSHFDSIDWERYRRDHISYISQSYGILPGATVLKNVVTALRLTGMDRKEASKSAREILEEVELWEFRRRRAARLSSGQKQRLSIARALAKPAPILIADEPTGNLDPENSAKVIQLLAHAAQTRLVLLVTHEFSEVQEHATRHIRLQDGRVVMDAPLRPNNQPKQPLQKRKPSRTPMSLLIAGLQLGSRPVWCSLMTVFFALTAFAVFAFLGAFIIALDDTGTRLYDPSAFRNGSKTRIVVSDSDLRPMDQADYDLLANLKYVTSVEPNGYVTDCQYAYREGVDYSAQYSEGVQGGMFKPEYVVNASYQFSASLPFMQTIPVLPQGQQFIKEGRLPESLYEVVAHSRDGFSVGDSVKIFLVNETFWSTNVNLPLTVKVVGITDHGAGLYFHADMGKFCQHVAHTGGSNQYYQFLPQNPDATQNSLPEGMILPEDYSPILSDEQCMVHTSIMASRDNEVNPFDGILTIGVPNINLLEQGLDPLHWKNHVQLSTQGYAYGTFTDPEGQKHTFDVSQRTHSVKYFTRLLIVSQNTFDVLNWQSSSEQVSLTIEDYAYTDRVIAELAEQGYVAVSPFKLGSTELDKTKADQRKQTLTICLLALLAVIALQIVVLRAMCSAQTESYLLLRNIGLVSKSAKLSILWQFLLFTLLGQLLGGGGIYLCAQLGVEKIAHTLRYLPPAYIAILSAVHLAAAMIAAAWVSHALAKQVYPLSDKFTDLQIEDTEMEAAL